MIRERWYAILEAKKVKNKPVGIKRMGADLVLWRGPSGEIVCMPDRCSHRGSVLNTGRIEGSCLECPFHGFQFDEEGHCRLIPANGKDKPVPRAFDLHTYVTREEHGFIWLWWGRRRDELPALPWFDEIPSTTANSHTIILQWDVSFERVMENMLDMHHFPFLHRKVRPQPGTLIDPFHAEIEGDVITIWGNLRPDNRKSVDEAPGVPFKTSVHFPGMMIMALTPKLRLLGACVPVDENSTWLAFRYYQSYIKAPVIGKILAWISAYLELKLVHPDDERLLGTVEPQHPTMGSYRLIHADKGIGLWLRHVHKQTRQDSLVLSEAEVTAGLNGREKHVHSSTS